MKLRRADLIPYAIPLALPYRSARGVRRLREGLLLRLWSDQGEVGLGEAAPLTGRTESFAEARAALETWAAHVETVRADPRVLLAETTAEPSEVRLGPAARAAVTTALCDLLATVEGAPLAGWLAARWSPDSRPLRRVAVNAIVTAARPSAAAAEAAAAAREGFPCVKVKIGVEPEEDLRRLRAVRDAIGPEVALRADANGAWSLSDALSVLQRLSDVELEYVEQPLPADRWEDHARLRRKLPIPIALDESIRDAGCARRILESGAADVLVLKPATLGGPPPTLVVAALAEAAGVGIVVTSALDTRVGRLAALHTAAATASESLRACGLATGRFLSWEPAAGEERLVAGHLLVPDRPGLGAHLRPDTEDWTGGRGTEATEAPPPAPVDGSTAS